MAYPESTHPYAHNLDETQTWVQPGSPDQLIVHFDPNSRLEQGYDFVYLYDKDDNPVGPAAGYTGLDLMLAGAVAVNGDTVKIRLVSDYGLAYWGYAVTNVESINLIPGADTGPAVLVDPVKYNINPAYEAGNHSAGPIAHGTELWVLGIVPSNWDPELPDDTLRHSYGSLCFYLSEDDGATWTAQDFDNSPQALQYAMVADAANDICHVAVGNVNDGTGDPADAGFSQVVIYNFNFTTKQWGLPVTSWLLDKELGETGIQSVFINTSFSLGVYPRSVGWEGAYSYVFVFTHSNSLDSGLNKLCFVRYNGETDTWGDGGPTQKVTIGSWSSGTPPMTHGGLGGAAGSSVTYIPASVMDANSRFHIFLNKEVWSDSSHFPPDSGHVDGWIESLYFAIDSDGTYGTVHVLTITTYYPYGWPNVTLDQYGEPYTTDVAPWGTSSYGYANAVCNLTTNEVAYAVAYSPGCANDDTPPVGDADQILVCMFVPPADKDDFPTVTSERVFNHYSDASHCTSNWDALNIAIALSDDYSTMYVVVNGIWKNIRNHDTGELLTEALFNAPWWDVDELGTPYGAVNRNYVYETHSSGSGWSDPFLLYDFNPQPVTFPAGQSDWKVMWQNASLSAADLGGGRIGVYTSASFTYPKDTGWPPYTYTSLMYAVGLYIGPNDEVTMAGISDGTSTAIAALEVGGQAGIGKNDCMLVITV